LLSRNTSSKLDASDLAALVVVGCVGKRKGEGELNERRGRAKTYASDVA
jgi:hypothetical protein